jgi:outer membrane protein
MKFFSIYTIKPEAMFSALLSFLIALLLCTNLSAMEDTVGTGPEGRYTLDDLYIIAQENSEQIKIAGQNLFIAQQDKSRAIAALFPWFTAFGNNTTYDESTLYEPDSISYGVKFEYDFSLNGRELTVYRMAKDAIEKSVYDLKAVKEEYLYQVAAAYFRIAALNQNLKVARLNNQRLKTHQKAVLTKLKLGEITKTNLFMADAELSKSKTDLVRVENMLRNSRATVINLVGLPDNFEIEEPDTNVPYNYDPEAFQLEELKKEALASRADLKSREQESMISDQNIKLAKSEYWPKASIEGIYRNTDYSSTSTQTDSGYEVEFDNDSESLSLALNLSFTFFDAGLRRAEVKQAKANAMIAKLYVEKMSKQISLEVEEAFLDVINQKSIIESLTDQLRSSQAHFDAVTKEFKHGLSDSLDVVDANNMLKNTQREFVNARYSYKLAEIKLKRVKGSFLKEILKAKHERQ